MFCPNCGTKNADNAAFCANCGSNLKSGTGGGAASTGGGTANTGGGAPGGIPPKNWMTEAILATVFGFLCSCLGGVFGIVAIVNASNVNKRFEAGDLAGAESAANQAKTWTIVAAVATVVLFIVSLIINWGMYMAMMQGDFGGY